MEFISNESEAISGYLNFIANQVTQPHHSQKDTAMVEQVVQQGIEASSPTRLSTELFEPMAVFDEFLRRVRYL